MSKICLYAIFDRKAEVYSQPLFFANDAVCFRTLREALNDANMMMVKHPDDYRLRKIGEFDDTTGAIVPVSVDLVEIRELVTAQRERCVSSAAGAAVGAAAPSSESSPAPDAVCDHDGSGCVPTSENA